MAFAIQNSNEDFLFYILKNKLISPYVLANQVVVYQLLEQMKLGISLHINVNVLSQVNLNFTDKNLIPELIEIAREINRSSSDSNILLSAHNPLLTLLLLCE